MPTRLLLAEDDAVIRLDLKEELLHLGYLVVGDVDNGASAIQLARELRPDLVIMCIRMPEIDGITAADILTRERIAPVMLLTAMSDDELIVRAANAGVIMYMTKPWRTSDLRPAIEMALARYRDRLALDRQVSGLEEQLVTRRVVERAAGILMERHGLTEPEAFRRMAKLAMNNRRSMREVAEAILLIEDLSEDTTK